MTLVGVVAALLVALVASQLLLPGYLGRRIERRLTADGGSASVTLTAVPALRLLARDGERLTIEGRDLRFRLDPSSLRSRSLHDFDGFDEVDLRLQRVLADPFRVHAFELTRTEDRDTYRLEIDAATSAGALLAYGLDRLPALLALPARGATGALAPDQGRIPVDIDAELASEGGRPRIVSARGKVAGLPAGPLVELLAGAILSKV